METSEPKQKFELSLTCEDFRKEHDVLIITDFSFFHHLQHARPLVIIFLFELNVFK